MSQENNFQVVFNNLKEILMPYANKLVLKCDVADEYHINTKYIMKNRKPMFFGSVKINKNYVSFHLMPVYVFPDLLSGISPDLKKRMQGKSCFNFATEDSVLFQELSKLVKNGYVKYKESGYL